MKSISWIKKSILLLPMFSLGIVGYSQESAEEDKTKVTFYGYISYEALFDSHRSVFSRDGELYLYPSAPLKPAETQELINFNPQLEMLSLQSRLGARIAGPDVLGAKVTGLVETDFLATAEAYKHMLRVRHAMMKMQWEKASVTLGQFWHPMFTPELFPLVVSFGAAAPYNPLNRSPQVRLDYTPTTSLKLVFAALAHGQFSVVGPEDAQRNSALPDLQFQLHIGNKPNFTTGFTVGYMWLQPLEHSSGGVTYRSNELLGAYNLQWFGRVKTSALTLHAKASYGENMTHHVMMGGYGRLLADTAKIYDYGYASTNSFASWIEAIYKINSNWEVGLFGGAMGTLGSNEKIDTGGPIWYERAAKMARAYRLSPRIVYTEKKMMFALEYLYNASDWGSSFDEYAKPQNLTRTINHRVLFAARYSF